MTTTPKTRMTQPNAQDITCCRTHRCGVFNGIAALGLTGVLALGIPLTLSYSTAHADQMGRSQTIFMSSTQPEQPDRATPSQGDAERLQAQGKWEEAATAWGYIAKDNPKHGTAWFNLGYCLHIAGNLEEAIPVHQKAATFAEYQGIALYNLGCAYALTGETDLAIQALASSQNAGFQLRGQAEGDSDLDSLRSDVRFQTLMGQRPASNGSATPQRRSSREPGFMDRVGMMWGQAQQIVQQNAPMVRQRLGMYAQQAQQTLQYSVYQIKQWIDGDDDAAADHPLYQEQRTAAAPRHAPSPPPTADKTAPTAPTGATSDTPDIGKLMQTGMQLQGQQKWNEAAAAFAVVAQASPDDANAHFSLAYCLHMAKDFESAIPAHQKAASFDATKGIALFNLACAYSLTDQVDKAVDALQASHDAGFDVAGSIATDTDLDNLRDNSRFIELQNKLKVEY